MVDIASDLQRRVGRVQGAMAQAGIGGLIVFYGAQHNMLRMDPILLLADYRVMGPSALLVPRDGAPKLVLTPTWDLARAREQVKLKDVTAVEEAALAGAIANAAKSLPQSLALVGREVMPLGIARALYRELGGEPMDGGDVVKATANTRTEIEIERISKAAKIADEGFRALTEEARVGMREYELAAILDATMQSHGSEDNFGLMSTGPHNVAIRAVSDRKLEPGDVIVGEITPCYRGYFAQLCRTLILGEPTALQREKYDLLLNAERAGFAAAKPGLPSSGIAKAVNDVIGAAGYGEFCRQPYMRTRGHGLGLGGVVPYDVTEDSSPLLETDMTMVIHPNQYIPETGYMMLGDTVVIEKGGARCLTETEQRLFWKEA
ncbi:MAG TPA: Xaa-Pro peptidase family protein [Alphaproteobacteria bacterium]|jgi:Xaa-Pro dipeptidase|nr:Xaa-Pro peptidase family protein [Alphaproteobacteria bacterium]